MRSRRGRLASAVPEGLGWIAYAYLLALSAWFAFEVASFLMETEHILW